MKRYILVTTLLALLAAVSVRATEIRRWERVPLTIPLVVGQERVILVDRNVRVAVPESLSEQLSVQSAGGAVYLRASAPIERSRLQLQDADSGFLILVDITATVAEPDRPPLEPIRIVDGNASNLSGDDTSRNVPRPGHNANSHRSREPANTPIAVVLTRFAAQSLYAPLRTVESVDGIARVPTRGLVVIDSLLPTASVRARVLAAWQLEDQWVTAVELKNASKRRVDLDPRNLIGDFLTATFQHPYLGPAGDVTDTTVVYLVTREHGLRDALSPAISSVDAASNIPAVREQKGGGQ